MSTKVYNDIANPTYSGSMEVANGDPNKKQVTKIVTEAICLDAKNISFKKCSRQVSSALLGYKVKEGENKGAGVFSDNDDDGKLEINLYYADKALKKYNYVTSVRQSIFNWMSAGTNLLLGKLPLTEYRDTPPSEYVEKTDKKLNFPFDRDNLDAAVKHFQDKYFKDIKEPGGPTDYPNITILKDRIGDFSKELQEYLEWSAVHAGYDVEVNMDLIPEEPDIPSKAVYNRTPTGKLIEVCSGFADTAAYILSSVKFASGHRIFTAITNVEINYAVEPIGHIFIGAKTNYVETPAIIVDNSNVTAVNMEKAMKDYGTYDQDTAFNYVLDDAAGGVLIGGGMLKTKLTVFKDFGDGKYKKYDENWSKFHWTAKAVKGLMHSTWGLINTTSNYDPIPIMSWNTLDFARVVKEYAGNDESSAQKIKNIIPQSVDHKNQRIWSVGLAVTLYEAAAMSTDTSESVLFAKYARIVADEIEGKAGQSDETNDDGNLYELAQLQKMVFDYQVKMDEIENENNELKDSKFFTAGVEIAGNDMEKDAETMILKTNLESAPLRGYQHARDFLVAILEAKSGNDKKLSELVAKTVASENGAEILGDTVGFLINSFPASIVKPIEKYIRNNQEALATSGNYLNSLHNFDKAGEVLVRAHSLNKKDIVTAYTYIKSLAARGYNETVRSVFSEVKDYEPKTAKERLLMAKMGKIYFDTFKKETKAKESIADDSQMSEIFDKYIKSHTEKIGNQELSALSPWNQIVYNMIELEFNIRHRGASKDHEKRAEEIIDKMIKVTEELLENKENEQIKDRIFGTLNYLISQTYKYYEEVGKTNKKYAYDYFKYAKDKSPDLRHLSKLDVSSKNISYANESDELLKQTNIALDSSRTLNERKAAVDRITATPYRELLAHYLTQLSKLVGHQIVASAKLFSGDKSAETQNSSAMSLAKYILSRNTQ